MEKFFVFIFSILILGTGRFTCNFFTDKAVNDLPSGFLLNWELTDTEELAYIIAAECMNCTPVERLHVGSCVINRLRHKDYPKTIKAVIGQENAFHGLCSEQYVFEPNCYEIAKYLMAGGKRDNRIIFFWRNNQNTPKYVSKILIKEKYHNFGR